MALSSPKVQCRTVCKSSVSLTTQVNADSSLNGGIRLSPVSTIQFAKCPEIESTTRQEEVSAARVPGEVPLYSISTRNMALIVRLPGSRLGSSIFQGSWRYNRRKIRLHAFSSLRSLSLLWLIAYPVSEIDSRILFLERRRGQD